MNSVLILALEYFKIGCVAIGGGYTVVPFLYYFVEKHHWYTVNDITQMIAVSNLTPGPIGINMATYVGLKVGGILGATLTTLAFMLPSFVIMYFVARFLKKYSQNECLCNVLYGLRPAAIALITVAGLKILNSTVLSSGVFLTTKNIVDLISFKSMIFLIVFVLIGLKLKKQPMWLILFAVALGFLTSLF